MHEALKRELLNSLGDTFEIVREIGRGVYGTVFRARDSNGRDVALTVLDPEFFREEEQRQRFLRECALIKRLIHPHILPILEADQTAGLLYYSSPFFEGASLRDRLNDGPLPLRDALRIGEQVADALTYAHAHQVLHRDIKPENVVFDGPDAMVKEFWIARAFSRSLQQRITGSGLVLGTPAYMSPEQMADKPLDARSDVYGFAVLLCEMLTRQIPFAMGPAQMVVEKLSREPRRADLPTELSDEVAELLMRALAKRARDRVASPRELIEKLRARLPEAWVDNGVAVGSLALGRGAIFARTRESPQIAGAPPSPVRVRLRSARPSRHTIGLGTLLAAIALLAATLVLGLEPRVLYGFGALGLSVAGLLLALPGRLNVKPVSPLSLRSPTELENRLRSALKYQYEITREVAHGGMAFVYLARDLRYRRRSVAIKVMRPEIAVGLGYEKFMEEIEITAQLSHPGILTVLDYGDADGLPFYVMPFVEGESVKARLDSAGPLPLDLAIAVVRDVGRALDYAHRKGVIHRDIKPENILWYEGQAVLADFGIARVIDRSRHSSFSQHVRLGTPEFMSPEQFWDTKRIDHRSDVYSLGCVMFEMLAGKTPYEGSPEELAVKHLKDPVPHVRSSRTDVSEMIDSAICKALSKKQSDRFDSAVAFGEAFGRLGHFTHPPPRPG
jgi:serine/threonine protein kinase